MRVYDDDRHPVVRVYVSSTYTDMMLEKNVLVTEVYPRLKELCRERYGLEFQVNIPRKRNSEYQ